MGLRYDWDGAILLADISDLMRKSDLLPFMPTPSHTFCLAPQSQAFDYSLKPDMGRIRFQYRGTCHASIAL